MKMKSYLQNAVLLTAAGLLLRLAGMFLRVYIAGELGSGGMGLYQLIFTAYGVFTAAANSGVAVAAARLTAEELGQNRPGGMLGAMRRVLALALGLGLAAGAAQGAGAGLMARYWLGDSRAALPLKILAFSLPFIALSAALRGCFLALRRVVPNIRAQLAEQMVRICLVFWLLPKGQAISLRLACAAVVAGNLVSEAVSFALMWLAWRRQKKEWPGQRAQKPEAFWKRLWAIMAPVEGNSLVHSLLKGAENALIPACLLGLLGKEGALAAYGALKGMAMPLLLFPFSFLGALATLLMPEITQAHVQGRRGELRLLADRMLLLTGAASVLAGGLFFLYGEELALVLYHDPEPGRYIRALGPVMPFVYMESMVDGALKGLGEQMAVFRYNLWDSLLRIAGILIFLPRYGMAGLLGVMAASNVFLCLLCCRRMLAVSGAKARWGSWLVWPAAVLLPGLWAGLQAAGRMETDLGRLCAGGAATAAVYLLFCLPGEGGRTLLRAIKSKKEPPPA